MALWEDHSRRPVGRSRWFPHNSAVRAPRPPGAGRNDPPKTPRPALGVCRTRPPGPRGAQNPSFRAAVGLTGGVFAVLGRCCRVRMCGIGSVGAVLHIRSEPVGGGSAESCGNSPAFNAVEILPCAESPCLHMGARALEIDVPGRTAESCGKPGVGPRGSRPPMCSTPRSVVRPAGSASRRPPAPAAAVRVRDVVRVRGRVRVVAALISSNGTLCACGEAGRWWRARCPRRRDVVRVRGGRDDGRRPANRGKWRSGRIVPPRTRRPPR